jgi:hypothetical protein
VILIPLMVVVAVVHGGAAQWCVVVKVPGQQQPIRT